MAKYPKKTHEKNYDFFLKNHGGLTPLKILGFFGLFLKIYYSGLKRTLSYSKYKKNDLLCLDFPQKHI